MSSLSVLITLLISSTLASIDSHDCLFATDCTSCLVSDHCRWCRYATPMQGQPGVCLNADSLEPCNALFSQGADVLINCNGRTAPPTRAPSFTRAPTRAPTLNPTPLPTVLVTRAPTPRPTFPSESCFSRDTCESCAALASHCAWCQYENAFQGAPGYCLDAVDAASCYVGVSDNHLLKLPTCDPSVRVTSSPTASPSQAPTSSPSLPPSRTPTSSPSQAPSRSPSRSPTSSPSQAPPSQAPSRSPSQAPTTPTLGYTTSQSTSSLYSTSIPPSVPSSLPPSAPFTPSPGPAQTLPTPTVLVSESPTVVVSSNPPATVSSEPLTDFTSDSPGKSGTGPRETVVVTVYQSPNPTPLPSPKPSPAPTRKPPTVPPPTIEPTTRPPANDGPQQQQQPPSEISWTVVVLVLGSIFGVVCILAWITVIVFVLSRRRRSNPRPSPSSSRRASVLQAASPLATRRPPSPATGRRRSVDSSRSPGTRRSSVQSDSGGRRRPSALALQSASANSSTPLRMTSDPFSTPVKRSSISYVRAPIFHRDSPHVSSRDMDEFAAPVARMPPIAEDRGGARLPPIGEEGAGTFSSTSPARRRWPSTDSVASPSFSERRSSIQPVSRPRFRRDSRFGFE